MTFDDDLGHVDQVVVAAGSRVTKPADPVRNDYHFDGWYISGSATAWNFSNVVTGNLNLKAHWSEIIEESQPEPEAPKTEAIRAPKTDDEFFTDLYFWMYISMAVFGIICVAGYGYQRKIRRSKNR